MLISRKRRAGQINFPLAYIINYSIGLVSLKLTFVASIILSLHYILPILTLGAETICFVGVILNIVCILQEHGFLTFSHNLNNIIGV